MASVATELIFILILMIANGILAMSELAVVSARKSRLEQRVEEGQRGARAALELATTPEDFLSTVQVGITLIGVMAGAVGGGGALADGLRLLLDRLPYMAEYSQSSSVVIVVMVITYLSLVVGELVPKRIALHNPEGIAVAVAPTMTVLAKATAPAARFLSWSSNLLLRFFHLQPNAEPPVTEQEVRDMIEQGTQVGVFEPIEEEIVGQVFRLSDRTVSALFTQRNDIVWLDIDESPAAIQQKVVESGFSRYPVAQGDLDNVLGLVSTQDLLVQLLTGHPLDLRSILQPVLFIPETTPALVVVERLKQTRSHIAFVIDEYGGLEGLVTLEDILTAIVGDIPDADSTIEPEVVRRDDGSWLVDGLVQVDEFQDLFEIADLPETGEGYYQTVGGLVMAMLGRVPNPGDHFEWSGYRLEVMDMDGRRVDKVLVTRPEASQA